MDKKSSDWRVTPELRSAMSAVGMTAKLQQKWVNNKTGAEEWRGIPSVTITGGSKPSTGGE